MTMRSIATRLRAPLLGAALLLAGPAHAQWHEREASKMGTRIVVQLWEPDSARAEQLLDDAMARLEAIEDRLSTYRAHSELSSVNRQAADGPVVVSEALFELLSEAQHVAELSRGAFDVTYESVGHLYAHRERRRPDDEQIEASLPLVDYRHLRLDAAARSVDFAASGVRVNLGGIAKGWACEQVVNALRAEGVEHALVSAGGDTRVLGDRRGQPWVVGLRDPDDADGVVTRLALQDEAISTSGDYERYFDEDGVRYHHILDPATGRPTQGIRSVTVIGPDGTLTDALSTTLFVMGVEEGLALLERLPGYDAVFIDARRGVRLSPGLAALAGADVADAH